MGTAPAAARQQAGTPEGPPATERRLSPRCCGASTAAVLPPPTFAALAGKVFTHKAGAVTGRVPGCRPGLGASNPAEGTGGSGPRPRPRARAPGPGSGPDGLPPCVPAIGLRRGRFSRNSGRSRCFRGVATAARPVRAHADPGGAAGQDRTGQVGGRGGGRTLSPYPSSGPRGRPAARRQLLAAVALEAGFARSEVACPARRGPAGRCV